MLTTIRSAALPLLFAFLSVGLALAEDSASKPALKKGDRIVFLGDSITQGGAGPKGYISVLREMIDAKYKELEIQCLGAGISGNKVPDLQRRVEKDVLAKNPTVVVIYIGINDVWHGEKNPASGTSKEAFEAGLKEVIGKCTAKGARVILSTPSVIGEKHDGTNNLDAKLDEYSDISRKVAKDLKLELCDLRAAFIAYLKANNEKNAERGILTGDRVHLNDAGNKFVAETMLKTLSP